MKVFKFGGASVKDAEGVKNTLNVLKQTGVKDTLIVVSAMGKMTNAFEAIVFSYIENKEELKQSITFVEEFHYSLINALFNNDTSLITKEVSSLFNDLALFLQINKSKDYDFVYDQIVGYGELISTKIISVYFNEKGIANTWLDARTIIKTDAFYRSAKVNWEQTQANITRAVKQNDLIITQGFLGSDANNFTTTLGREGSDYSAAIFGYCLNAENVTIWKDVDGVLNADPRYFDNAKLLEKISYTEAIELAFYGASVIHPKTLQPLQQKEIPLLVKSFFNPEAKGSKVCKVEGIYPQYPCFILKRNQVLLSLSTLDFSFLVEENISEIFGLLAKYKMKVDVIQNSAISFSVCLENTYNNLEALLMHLKSKFKVSYRTGVDLYTIRHFNEEAINEIEKGKDVLLRQQHKQTIQLITK